METFDEKVTRLENAYLNGWKYVAEIIEILILLKKNCAKDGVFDKNVFYGQLRTNFDTTLCKKSLEKIKRVSDAEKVLSGFLEQNRPRLDTMKKLILDSLEIDKQQLEKIRKIITTLQTKSGFEAAGIIEFVNDQITERNATEQLLKTVPLPPVSVARKKQNKTLAS